MSDPEPPDEPPTIDRPPAAGVHRPEPGPRLPPGLLIAERYRIVRFIAQGGMGEVYEAEDTELRERVALKTVRSEIASNPGSIERFKREVHLARQVTHPNVARIFDIGHHGPVFFLSMEFLAGETLEARLRRDGRMTTEQALPLVAQMASGLAAAHKVGIVHRDFKSANVMLVPSSEGERVVVTDFGLARGPAVGEGSVTSMGAIVGTPDFMAPEQVQGGAITAATDQYALGLVLYEMVTGARPFTGESPLAAVFKRLTEPPASPRAHVKDLDPRWEAVLLRCLERDPADRFTSVLEVVKSLGGAPISEGRRAVEGRARWRRRALFAFPAVGLLLVGLVLAYRFLAGYPRTIDSIAVLPFVNVGGDPEMEYLSDGITDGLIHTLSRLPKLTVMSRNSVFRYKGRETDAQQAGRDLKVMAVLAGRMARRAEQLSVSTELVKVRDNSHVWGGQYDSRLSDVLTVQEDIARQISEKLHLTRTREEEKRLLKPTTESPEAFELYLKGRYFSSRWTIEGLKKGIDFMNRAIEKDPSYALAYAGLAACYYDASGLYLSPDEAMPKAKAAALRALSLDEMLAEAHHALALVLSQYEWNWQEAEKEYRRAIELSPSLAPAHQHYGFFLAIQGGRLHEGLAELTRARELDPLTPLVSTNLAWLHYVDRNYDTAIAQLEKIIEIDKTFVPAHYTLGLAYEQKAMFTEALAQFGEALVLAPDEPYTLSCMGQLYAVMGRTDEARRVLEELKAPKKSRYVDPFYFGAIHAGLGEEDQAFSWFEKALEAKSEAMLWVGVDPRFERLRSDPRFARLLERAGLMQGVRP